ncbi:acyltransferase family protein [Robertmurraya andreesenii]|uniref:Peptidoglycan/LPS O-acetylase OafA/YrhL n=1 Tax=Anoxybacillus andreesenii TaxID=1325932 RepID=A0ABT9V366_9BACL|nr:acyltransferase [Robertmurraya andreesenii]MDQ0155382.1 peptidoglycan/LPS O-acetylase OafA/YrhL [Robertmurraya andreesenii]
MRKQLNLIQFSRALVPLFVILLHAKAFMATYFHYDFLHLPHVARSGGVYYFFALSGFMVYYLYHKDFGNQGKVKDYLYKRFIRIYPFYWILTLCILPVYFIFPSLGSGNERHIGHIIASFLLYPDDEYPILSVAWSLSHTVFFYLIISLSFFEKKFVSVFIPAVWGFLSLLFSIEVLKSSHYFINFLFSFNNLIFLLGVACAYLVTKIPIQMGISKVMIFTGLIGFPLSWINEEFGYFNIDLQITTTISSIFLLIGFSSIDLQREITIPKMAKFLGDASFSIYLTHFTCMSALSIILSSMTILKIPNFLLAILLIVFSIIFGSIIHVLLEKPLNRKLRNLYNRKKGFPFRWKPSA